MYGFFIDFLENVVVFRVIGYKKRNSFLIFLVSMYRLIVFRFGYYYFSENLYTQL